MDNVTKVFVKTEGTSNDQNSFTMSNMRGTVSVGQANRSSTSMPKGERKCETKELKDTLFQAQEFAFNEYSTELGKLSGR